MQVASTMKLIVSGTIIISLIIASSLFVIERQKRHNAELKLSQVSEQRDSLIALNNKQVAKINAFNQIGVEHAEQLSAATEEIDRLSDRLRTGPERVFVKADCPTAVPDTTSTGSVGDAAAARLTQAAEQDYLRLRRMMAENLQQTKYLQDYINTQCIR
ncbi:lysis protein [Vibrio sp. H11]|uniref:lysis protein n=1 Tax=Vibrio sp. H11 TaxID=2565928 RepID=UPI001F0FAEE3|nr:lysis protein [Vibrio sp. H11]